MGQSNTHATVLFLGLEGSGKSSIIKYCDLGFKVSKDEIKPTIGHETKHITTKKVAFTAFDVPGKKKFQDLWKKYYVQSDAIVWVVDSTAEDLEDVQDTLTMVLQAPELRQAVFLVVFNKTDKKEAKKPQELVEKLDLVKLMGKRVWKAQGVCALTGEGIQDAISWLAEEIKKAIKLKEQKEKEKK